ncbi:hypothetical protein BHF71_10320 [Vulcanibacillus modesticaldus]|uniref:DUF6884 domain-containing protein n=1 Tax=Vulcanibacillus modesticaldus TaxID=337097 RepID=A0A1D2YT03_9BACI|nr:DUF6884 domain-containing protein [Vulcanibacillus modesticaldus]OEF98818.1 hypothetical protein BHF71_10320 [Vulcanibacillus modesticaldus]
MKKVVLLSCVSKKKDYETIAENLYDSSLFKYSLKYARFLKPDKIYILSALYGLIETTDKIAPYNKTLNSMKKNEKIEWSNMVLKQMKDKGLDLKNDHFIILAGNNYRKYLLEHFSNYEIPLEGMRIGEQLSFLKGSIAR